MWSDEPELLVNWGAHERGRVPLIQEENSCGPLSD